MRDRLQYCRWMKSKHEQAARGEWLPGGIYKQKGTRCGASLKKCHERKKGEGKKTSRRGAHMPRARAIYSKSARHIIMIIIINLLLFVCLFVVVVAHRQHLSSSLLYILQIASLPEILLR